MQVPHSGVAREPLAVWPYPVFPYITPVVPESLRSLLRLDPYYEHADDQGIPGAPGTVLNTIALFLIADHRASLGFSQLVSGAGLVGRNSKMAIEWLYDHHMLERSGPRGRMRYKRKELLLRLWVKERNRRRKAGA